MAESKTKDALAHPDLEEMISEFGEADGLKYYRAGLSLDEARAEDYALLKAERAARLAAEEEKPDEEKPAEEPEKPEEETGKLGDGEGGDGDDGDDSGDDSGEDETAPTGASTKKKDDEKEDGAAELKAQLSAELDSLRAEIASLKATFRRGEDNPLDGTAAPKTEDKRPNVFKQADVLRAKGIE